MAQAVLPSNAPPLRDDQGIRAALQEHSANRQQIYHHHHHYPALTGYEQHKVPIAATENAYAARPAVPGVYYNHQPAYYRQTYHQRHADTDRESQNRVDRQWKALYERFLHCPRYKEYRGRQHKGGKTGSGQKWPENLERAFFKALLYWPPMGRRKHQHKDKQRGRNELIADYIMDITGVGRTRKQVSSHIQVLKPLVAEDQQIMRWMSDKGDEPVGDSARKFAGYQPQYTSGRMRSTYTAGVHTMPADSGSEYRVPTRDAVRLAKPQLDVFEPFEFKLLVQPIVRSSEENEALHTYTASTHAPNQADEHIADWTLLSEQYPLLASMHALRPIDCNVLAVEASISMPKQPWRSTEEIELAVVLGCMSRRLLQNCKIRCVNRFYKGGQALPSVVGKRKMDCGSGDAQLTMAESGDRAETLLKFGSGYWAEIFRPNSTLARSIMASEQAGPDDRARIRRSVDADMRTYNAIQEISVLTNTGLETVLVMHWSFRLSSSDCGSTTWRRLHIPAATTSQPSTKAEMSSNGMAADTSFDFNAPIDLVAACTAGAQQGYPALQSPFEYDSGSTSDTSPTTTWPTTISTAGSQVQNGMNMDDSMVFSQQGMMLDGAMGYDGFDTTAFSFDADANYDFDPNAVDVQMYAQKWANAPVNGFTDSFDSKQWPDYSTQAAYASYPQGGTAQQPEAYAVYGTQKGYEDQMYRGAAGSADEQQAYAGAVERLKSEQLSGEAWSTTSMRC